MLSNHFGFSDPRKERKKLDQMGKSRSDDFLVFDVIQSDSTPIVLQVIERD